MVPYILNLCCIEKWNMRELNDDSSQTDEA